MLIAGSSFNLYTIPSLSVSLSLHQGMLAMLVNSVLVLYKLVQFVCVIARMFKVLQRQYSKAAYASGNPFNELLRETGLWANIAA